MTLPRIGFLALGAGLLAGCAYSPPPPTVIYAYVPCAPEAPSPAQTTMPPPPYANVPAPLPPGPAGPQCVVRLGGPPALPPAAPPPGR